MHESGEGRDWYLVGLRAEVWQQTRGHSVSLSRAVHWFRGQDLTGVILVTQGAF